MLLDDCFEATAIYEADRDATIAALTSRGSIARYDCGALAASNFKAVGTLRWQHASRTSSRATCCHATVPNRRCVWGKY